MTNPSQIAVEHGVDDLPLWRDPQAYQTVCDVLERHGVPEERFASLVEAYRSHAHKQRTRGLNDDFDAIFALEGD